MVPNRKSPLILYRTESPGSYLNPATGNNEDRVKKGYRCGEGIPFYEIYWERISHQSPHYLISEWMVKDKRLRSGPYPVEIFESDVNEEFLDGRCLHILKNTLERWGEDKSRIENAAIKKYLPQKKK